MYCTACASSSVVSDRLVEFFPCHVRTTHFVVLRGPGPEEGINETHIMKREMGQQEDLLLCFGRTSLPYLKCYCYAKYSRTTPPFTAQLYQPNHLGLGTLTNSWPKDSIMKPTTLKRYSMQVWERGLVQWTWLHGSVSSAGVLMGLTGACHDHVPGTSISLEYELIWVSIRQPLFNLSLS